MQARPAQICYEQVCVREVRWSVRLAKVAIDAHYGAMSVRRIGLLITSVTGLVVAGLGAYFAYIDDARANAQATILGSLAQVAGLAAAVYACWPRGKTSPASVPSICVNQEISGSRIDDSTVIGYAGLSSTGHDERTPR